MNEHLMLYSFAFVARRKQGPATDTGIGTGITLARAEEEAEMEATSAAFDAFPVSDGWEDHEFVIQEVKQGLAFNNGHRLIWQVEKP